MRAEPLRELESAARRMSPRDLEVVVGIAETLADPSEAPDARTALVAEVVAGTQLLDRTDLSGLAEATSALVDRGGLDGPGLVALIWRPATTLS